MFNSFIGDNRHDTRAQAREAQAKNDRAAQGQAAPITAAPSANLATASEPQDLENYQAQPADDELWRAVKTGGVPIDHLMAALRERERPELNANVNFPDGSGNSPLHMVARYGDAEKIEALINAGALPNVANDAGQTPLHVVARHGNAAMTASLIRAGASLTAKDCVRKTPLHWASRYRNAGAVEALLSAGADARAKNVSHKTPLGVMFAPTGAPGRNHEANAIIIRKLLQRQAEQRSETRDVTRGEAGARPVIPNGPSR